MMSELKWDQCIEELRSSAPLLLEVLTAVVSQNDNRNAQKCGAAHFPGICLAVAAILKERNREMCGVQSIVSLILMASGVDKKVCIVCMQSALICDFMCIVMIMSLACRCIPG